MTETTITTQGCGVANPGGTPCTRNKGHEGGHDLASYGPPETPILDESAVSEIEAQLNSGSLLLPLRVDHWHMSLNSGGGWYIKNASDRIVMTVAFVPVEIETGKPALNGNAPARHTAALLNSIPALCATVKNLRAQRADQDEVNLGVSLNNERLLAQNTDLQSQLEQLRAENERLIKERDDARSGMKRICTHPNTYPFGTASRRCHDCGLEIRL